MREYEIQNRGLIHYFRIIRYNFKPIDRYRALNYEEAEAEFENRNKILNHYELMSKRRIEEAKGEAMDEKEKKAAKSKNFCRIYYSVKYSNL